MNTTEIVKHILEGEFDEFDPLDYVKSAKNRESAVEIYNGPLVRVIQPLAAYTLNNYLGPNDQWDAVYYQETADAGPIYLAVDKSDHDNMAIFQPSTSRVWNNQGREQEWRQLGALMMPNKDDDKNWLDLQQGLATYFMAQIAKKKNVGQWVKCLTMIGRTDLATNYARYLGRAKLPFSKSIDAVLAMKKAGKRSRNRIARLMQNQKDVKWGERGFWLLFNDWVDLAPFYGESRDHDYASNAEKIFGGDTREWFEGNMGNTEPGDAWSEINDSNMSLIRQLLVNRTVYNSDGEEHTVTRDNVAELDDGELKDIVCDRGNTNDSCEDIADAIRYAADDAYISGAESAYYDGYKHALLSEWGLSEDSTVKWIKVGKKAPDKKLEGGMAQKGEQKSMLGLYFPYSQLEQWIAKWKEDEYEDDYYGDIHELAKAYLPKIEPSDEYSGDNDSEYFNEQLDYHLNEIETTAPEKQVDPGQPELPLEGEPGPQAGSLEKNYTVAIGQHPDEKVYKGIPKGEATKYRETMKPKRDDITFRAESFLAHPLNRIDEIDPKAFTKRVPRFYVLAWEWEPGQRIYFGRYPTDNYAQGGGSPDDPLTVKFDSAEEAEQFLASAKWGEREWGTQKPYTVVPVYLDGAMLEERHNDIKIEFEASDEAAESIVPLLKELKKMGSQGSSRNIKIEDWDGRSKFGFDGDGASKIGEIKVNGEVVESQQLEEAVYKLSTTQIDLPKEIGGHIIQWGELNIADDDLYIDEKDGCGRETEQHVSVLYGLTAPSPSQELIDIVEATKPFLVEFGGVSVFENAKYDVIKLDVISEELHNLHSQIRKACPNENKFPDYIPHCTVAYVQKGKGKKYAGQDVFKTAKVPRDFWAYDLLFKGAGDSEDSERVVQLIHFDKSKPIEKPDEPEAGEQRYPQATEEEPEMAVAENLDPKAFLDRNVPMDCPECHSTNLSDPDEEGLVDCGECGIWFDPFHPANKPVRESAFHGNTTYNCGHVSNCRCNGPHEARSLDEACPLCKSKLPESLDETDPKALALKTQVDSPHPVPVSQQDGLPVYAGKDAYRWLFKRYGIPNSITAPGDATPFGKKNVMFVDDHLDGKPMAIWVHEALEMLPVAESDDVDPKKFSTGQSVDPHPDWMVFDRKEDQFGQLKINYRHKNGRITFKLLNTFFGNDKAPFSEDWKKGWSVYVYDDSGDFLDGDNFEADTLDIAETTAVNLAFDMVHNTAPSLFQPKLPRRNRRQQESEELDVKQFLGNDQTHQFFDLYTAHGERPVMKHVAREDLARYRHRIARKNGLSPRDIITLPSRVSEAEEINAKEFLARTTKYRIRTGVGARTRYIQQDPSTRQMMWKDYDEATLFASEEAEAIMAEIGSDYGGQPVTSELVDDGHQHPDTHLGESDATNSEIDPKAMALRTNMRFVVESSHTPPQYLFTYEGTQYGGARTTADRSKATIFNMDAAEQWVTHLNSSSKNYTFKAVPAGVNEALNGPFEDDGLPGEVSTFLRKVRSKRRKPKPVVI